MIGRKAKRPSVEAQDNIRESVDELAARFELDDAAADALELHVRFANWENANFVPESVPKLPDPRPHLSERGMRGAPNLLLESLSVLEVESIRHARHVADIGSGAGFPGIVLAIALPDASVTLVERDPGRRGYLRREAAALGLKNVQVEKTPVHIWSEGLGRFDLVTARKVGRPNTIIEWAAPLLVPGGTAALFYGPRDPASEALAAPAAEANDLMLTEVRPVPATTRRGDVVTHKKHVYVYRKTGPS
jgi:16S rRNA (guanine527-N7)-methyltransferase